MTYNVLNIGSGFKKALRYTSNEWKTTGNVLKFLYPHPRYQLILKHMIEACRNLAGPEGKYVGLHLRFETDATTAWGVNVRGFNHMFMGRVFSILKR
eukprot:gene1537-1935_t